MKESEWKSLGYTKQFEYVNSLEEINKQKTELIKLMEKETYKLKSTIASYISVFETMKEQLLKLADKSIKRV